MKCPRCSTELTRVRYEGFPAFRCEQCYGYLVGRERLETIKHVQTRPVQQLKQEVLGESQGDSQDELRCPGCRGKMQKQFVQPPASIHVDLCTACRLVWLDGGELARLQLSHRISPQGLEEAELRRRYREMSPARRAQLEQNIASLPESLPDEADSDSWGNAWSILRRGL